MKDEEKSKKSSKKLIIVIAVIIVIAAIAFGFYKGIFSLPTGLAAAQTTGNQVAPQTTQTTNQAGISKTGIEIINKEFSGNLPYSEFVGNLTPGNYLLQFVSDVPVWVDIYRDYNFNLWKQGQHMGILGGTSCCNEQDKTKSLTQSFTVSYGYEGNSYIVVEGDQKASIKYSISKV